MSIPKRNSEFSGSRVAGLGPFLGWQGPSPQPEASGSQVATYVSSCCWPLAGGTPPRTGQLHVLCLPATVTSWGPALCLLLQIQALRPQNITILGPGQLPLQSVAHRSTSRKIFFNKYTHTLLQMYFSLHVIFLITFL